MSGVGQRGRDPNPIASRAAFAGNAPKYAAFRDFLLATQVHRVEKRGFG